LNQFAGMATTNSSTWQKGMVNFSS